MFDNPLKQSAVCSERPSHRWWRSVYCITIVFGSCAGKMRKSYCQQSGQFWTVNPRENKEPALIVVATFTVHYAKHYTAKHSDSLSGLWWRCLWTIQTDAQMFKYTKVCLRWSGALWLFRGHCSHLVVLGKYIFYSYSNLTSCDLIKKKALLIKTLHIVRCAQISSPKG